MSRIPTTPRTTTKPRPPPAISARTRTASSTTASASSPARPKPPSLTPKASKSSLRSIGGKSPASPRKGLTPEPPIESPSKPALSIREAIALKRAEAKKAQASTSRGFDDVPGPDALPDHEREPEEEPDMLGRWTVRETIEQARSTGNLNLASRDLPCIPSVLFEVHLGLNCQPLALVPNEPAHPPSDRPGRRRGGDTNVSWYEAQDLEVLKAGNNEILEIQPEISLFGSLKNVDLHHNKLTALPPSFADLMSLSILDLSHNSLTALPPNLFALPNLVNLDVSHNALTALPFSSPFSDQPQNGFTSYTRASDDGNLFAPVLSRATKSLPALHTLNASHNRIPASAIEHGSLPSSIAKLNLSANPLGGGSFGGRDLVLTLSRLTKLSELFFSRAELSDDAFPAPSSAAPDTAYFPSLRILDAGETLVTAPRMLAFLAPTTKEVQFDVTKDMPPPGAVRVVIGKQVVKEAWEIEAERRARGGRAARWATAAEPEAVDEWASAPSKVGSKTDAPDARAKSAQVPKKEVVKEAWEIEAENGLNTAGARRRARALAAAAEAGPVTSTSALRAVTPEKPAEAAPAVGPSGAGHLLSHSQYWDANTGTLTLPTSLPAARNAHNRSFSLASPRGGASTDSHLALPAQTLPLSLIVTRPIASDLRVLVLTGRRLDSTFDFPASWKTSSEGFLPKLETFSLENCKLGDTVPTTVDGGSERTSVPLLPTIAALFPSLRSLDLSYNGLTSAALTEEALSALILSSSKDPASADDEDRPKGRAGLRRLSIRGNQLEDIDGFIALGGRFRANRTVPEWGLDELDVRDNSLSRLPAELGLLPLDVLLVDGNVFRVPPRRVWEREGTRGLLSWLRGRLE